MPTLLPPASIAVVMAGVIGLRGPDIDRREALRGYKVEFKDADRPFIRPHTGLPVLYMKGDKPVVERHVFGFSKRFSSFNAREDKLDDSKMWSTMWGKHHGVAPVSYILEWAGEGEEKVPYRIERADGAAMAVPALVGAYWEHKEDRAFALVTIEPNEFVRSFHDRMIGQLTDEGVDMWLHPEKTGKPGLRKLLAPPPNDELVARPLRKDAGKAKFDDPKWLEPVGPALTWADVKRKSGAAAKPKASKQKSLVD